jgi:hypothetical protein
MVEGIPGETPVKRVNRNFNELLQELRVTQTGVQILFAFLLAMPLQARFRELDLWERNTYVTALLLSAAATACIIAPVAYHRALFRQSLKEEIVQAANLFARVGLVMLLLAISVSIQLVLDIVLGRTVALGIAITVGVVLLLLWFVLPAVRGRHLDPDHEDPERGVRM